MNINKYILNTLEGDKCCGKKETTEKGKGVG